LKVAGGIGETGVGGGVDVGRKRVRGRNKVGFGVNGKTGRIETGGSGSFNTFLENLEKNSQLYIDWPEFQAV
jgi:hypothetical protein